MKSYATGSTRATWTFGAGQLVNLAAKAGASKVPLIKPWADRIGDAAEKLADLALESKKEGCIQ